MSVDELKNDLNNLNQYTSLQYSAMGNFNTDDAFRNIISEGLIFIFIIVNI